MILAFKAGDIRFRHLYNLGVFSVVNIGTHSGWPVPQVLLLSHVSCLKVSAEIFILTSLIYSATQMGNSKPELNKIIYSLFTSIH